ncbi:hypothetical protein KPH14_008263 [Odynerus spinipes]|uniref:Protein maelstrom homolog n=1 Tax=Odynerus spinipes TaxID=1348599 RepID=A0AAD9RH00_9HYME|nr:hypothetical protein KPH14_008263 [Odynerus spinipes]
MPKKQKGQNAFFYFMLEWRQREEKSGRKFASLRDVQADPRCSDEWKGLSPQQKKVYETMAKQCKPGGMDKKTNVGESLSLVQMEQRKETEFLENMQLYINTTINGSLKNNNLSSTKFYFIHFNWFYITEDKEKRHAPAEYAVGEFTLENGIQRYHHKLVHIKPELGYTWEAIETSRTSHKIPYELPQGERNFYDMYMDLLKFLEPAKINGKYPPFFTGKKLSQGVSSLFDQLTATADHENTFLVYSIESLFAKLHNVALAHRNVDENDDPLLHGMLDAVGESEFSKDKFAFETNIECDYHKNLDGTSQYCSLSVIRQWAYTMCDYCCEPLDIKRRPGINCPHPKIDDDLTTSLLNMSLNTTVHDSDYEGLRLGSMTGVTEEHRLKVSERTHKEEQGRRKDPKPLHIIDHSKVKEHQTSASTSTTYERPLRPPNTKSFAVAAASGKQGDIPDFGDMNFPSIGGRGVMLKKKPNISKQPVGRGYGGY